MGGKSSAISSNANRNDDLNDDSPIKDASGSDDQEYPHKKYLQIQAKVKSKDADGRKRFGLIQMPKRGKAKGDLEPDNGILEENSTDAASPLKIRQQQLQDLQEARPQLSEQQLDLVSSTWEIIQQQMSQVGSDAFDRMFQSYPDVKGAFGPFRSLSSEDSHYSQEIRAHGRRVLGTVELVVVNRDNPEVILNHLHELGHKHITYNAKVEFMDLICQMFLFAIEPVLKESWNIEVEQAWAQLFRFITHLMKESMML